MGCGAGCTGCEGHRAGSSGGGAYRGCRFGGVALLVFGLPLLLAGVGISVVGGTPELRLLGCCAGLALGAGLSRVLLPRGGAAIAGEGAAADAEGDA